MDRETHKFNFERWERMEETNAKGPDRLLEFIGTGTFALSLTLITGFGPETLAKPWLIILSWIFFGLAILVHISAYMYAIHGLGSAKQRLLEIPIGAPDSRSPEERKTEKRLQEQFTYVNDILRYAVLALMSVGMLLLIMFASVNLLLKDRHQSIPLNLDGSFSDLHSSSPYLQ